VVSFSFCSLSLVESLYLLFFLYLLDLLVYLVLDLLLSLLLFAFDLSFHLICLPAELARLRISLFEFLIRMAHLAYLENRGVIPVILLSRLKHLLVDLYLPESEYVFLFRWLPSRTILSSPSVPVALVSVPVLLVDCLLFRGNKE